MLLPLPDDFGRAWDDWPRYDPEPHEPDPGTVEGALYYTGQDDELDEARAAYLRRGSNAVDLDGYATNDPKRVTLEDA